MARTIDPLRAEQEARALWAALTPSPVVVADDQGRKRSIEPGDRLREIERRARLIAASDSLAQAIVARLRDHDVEAELEHVRVDPRGGDEQVMAIRHGDRVVAIRPAATVLRVYLAAEGIALVGEPLAEVDVVTEPDGWAPAQRIAAALSAFLF